jgi:hypothetical protein
MKTLLVFTVLHYIKLKDWYTELLLCRLPDSSFSVTDVKQLIGNFGIFEFYPQQQQSYLKIVCIEISVVACDDYFVCGVLRQFL